MKTINMYYLTPLVAAIVMANTPTANAQLGINLGGSAGLTASSSISGSVMGMGGSSSLSSGLSASSALSLTGGLGALDSVINSLSHTTTASGETNGAVTLTGLGDFSAGGNTEGVVDLVSGLSSSAQAPSLPGLNLESQVSAAADAVASVAAGRPTPGNSSDDSASGEPELNEPADSNEPAEPQGSESGNDGLTAAIQSTIAAAGSVAGGGSVPSSVVATAEAALSSTTGATANYGEMPTQESPDASTDDAEPETDEVQPQESDAGNDLFASLQSATEVAGSFTGNASVPDSVIATLEASGSSASDLTVGLNSVGDKSDLDVIGSSMASAEGAASLEGALEGSQIASILLMSKFQSAQEMAASIESAGQDVSATGETSTDFASNTTASVQ